ncbi:DUF5069 domain-containing protein [Horticoccus luteus]|uniref:Gluconokinase n=1 Tax=Horticoccus luteus TaxID=2862869 RepID=A0A8F9XL27_9BACT|nr:gluconokinase, GntK/IdnK-type [Horticoccus luteus]QYM78639.1 DUF5069 domain-containing protein [Horticoccus luteus]
MPSVPGLRSPYLLVGRLVYFGRMLDKIRLHARAALPADYVPNLGRGFDGRCCEFLRVAYPDLVHRTLAGDLPDEALLAWCHEHGGPRTDAECETWNGFLMKRGWRDAGADILAQRIRESHLEDKPIATMFDYLDFDEGRDPVARRAWAPRESIVIVLMGVSGSGKTTVGLKLASALGWSFRDADEFHSPANIAKMSAGTPLDDDDRAPWLAAIRAYIEAALSRGENTIVTCSALKDSYRHVIVADPARVKLVHLTGDFALLLARMSERHGHFMKADMLQSQIATLELPDHALTLNVAQTPAELVAQIRTAFVL